MIPTVARYTTSAAVNLQNSVCCFSIQYIPPNQNSATRMKAILMFNIMISTILSIQDVKVSNLYKIYVILEDIVTNLALSGKDFRSAIW